MKYTLPQIFKDEKLREIGQETYEIGIDVLKDVKDVEIPYLSSGLKLLWLPTKIKEFFFSKKMNRFIFEINKVDKDKLVEFAIKMEDEEIDSKVGETTLIILDKLEREEKATLIGKLFKGYIEEKISKDDYLRVSIMIERCYLEDINELGNNEIGIVGLNSQTKVNLYIVGVLNQELKDSSELNKRIEERTNQKSLLPPTFEYKLNNYGEMIRKYCFDK